MPTPDPDPAIVLLSGGIDSTTALAQALAVHPRVYALSFRYGQRHEIELACAARQARRPGVAAHEIVELSQVATLVRNATALVGTSTLEVPKDRDVDAERDIPTTYVPARNTLFLAYALVWAEAVGATAIYIGVNALDYSGYPDCRPEFIEAFTRMANLGTRSGVEGLPIRIEAPLIALRKHEIIALGLSLGVDYADTVSCYDPHLDDDARPLACGRCDSCQLRRRGFELAGAPDPTRYVPRNHGSRITIPTSTT